MSEYEELFSPSVVLNLKVSKNERKYQVLGENGGEYTRNRFHIRSKATPFDESFEAAMYTPRDQDGSQADTNERRPVRERRAPLWHNDYVQPLSDFFSHYKYLKTFKERGMLINYNISYITMPEDYAVVEVT